MLYIKECLTKKYFQFSGRARRKEYWLFYLFTMVVSTVFAILGKFSFPLLTWVPTVFLTIPCLAVCVRRLHDTNRSGWWYLISFVPIIGTIWFVVLMCLKGNIGPNSRGDDPLDQSTLELKVA